MDLDLETQCREFAAEYPTPAVRAAIKLAERGDISWSEAYTLFRRVLREAYQRVATS